MRTNKHQLLHWSMPVRSQVYFLHNKRMFLSTHWIPN